MYIATNLHPPPASSGEEAENRRVTAAQKPRQSGPSPALPTVTLFAIAACRLIGLLGGHHPASPFASGTPSHPEPQTAGRSLGFRITKFMRKLAGLSALIQCFCPSNINSDNFDPLSDLAPTSFGRRCNAWFRYRSTRHRAKPFAQ